MTAAPLVDFIIAGAQKGGTTALFDYLADDPAITIDATELDDARWFSRDEVRAAMADDPDAAFIAPPATAIAHHLLRWWLHTG